MTRGPKITGFSNFFQLPPSDYDPDKDSLQLTSDESLPASPKTVPPPPPKKRKADPAPEPLTITREFSDLETPPGFSSSDGEAKKPLSKSQKQRRRKKAKKRQKALENQSAPQLEPTLEVNHEIRRLSHEIMVVLQRSARVISQSSFPKSKDGKKLTKLTQQLFCGDLAFSANQILMGSKMSLKAFLAAKQTLDEYQPMRPDAVKEKATSSKK